MASTGGRVVWAVARRVLRAAAADGRGGREGRRLALDAVGRVLWLLSCAAGGVLGWLVAVAAQGLAGAEGPWTRLAGALGGLALGSQRGWHRRLRLAGLTVSPAARHAGTVLFAAALAAGLWTDLRA